MIPNTPEIAAARIEAARARDRMMETARELQDEFLELISPQTWARDIWEGAKEKGADLAEEAVDAVARRPAIASGVVAALALFFAREPLIDAAGKLAKGVKAKRQASKAKPRASKPRPRNPRISKKTTETIA